MPEQHIIEDQSCAEQCPSQGILVPLDLASFKTQDAMSLNGTGSFASAGVALLNDLTGRTDLHLLTLPWWVGDLPRRGQLRATPAWCPSCLAEWKDKEQPFYQ